MPEKQFLKLFNMVGKIHLNQALKAHLMGHFRHAIYIHLQPQMGGFIDESSVSISVLQCEKDEACLLLKCSVFYEEKIGGCNCNDDPHSENGYDEIHMKLYDGKITIL